MNPRLAVPRAAAIGVLLAVALLFAGCRAPREVNRLALITVAAFDLMPTGEVRWTVEVPLPSLAAGGAVSGGGGGGTPTPSGARSYVIYEGVGRSLGEAERRLAQSVTREIFWAHANYILVGEAAARAGLDPLVEFVGRRFEFRRTALLFVTPGEAGETLRRIQPALDRTIGAALTSTVRIARLRPFRDVDVNLFLRRLNEPGIDPHLPVLTFRENPTGEISPILAGTALFQGNRLVAFLPEPAEQGLYWLRAEIRQLTLSLPCPETLAIPAGVTIHVRESTASLQMRMVSGNLQAFVQISAEGDLDEWSCPTPLDGATLRLVEEATARRIRDDAQAAVQAMRRTGTDPVGFGAALYRSDPERWAALRAEWPNVLSRLPVVVDVRVHVRRPGLILEGR